MKNMKHEDKIKYMCIAMGLQHVHIQVKMADLILSTYDEVKRLGGDFTIKDAIRIKEQVLSKYEEKEKKEEEESSGKLTEREETIRYKAAYKVWNDIFNNDTLIYDNFPAYYRDKFLNQK